MMENQEAEKEKSNSRNLEFLKMIETMLSSVLSALPILERIKLLEDTIQDFKENPDIISKQLTLCAIMGIVGNSLREDVDEKLKLKAASEKVEGEKEENTKNT